MVFLAGGAADPTTTLVFDLTTRTRLANAKLTGPFASSVAAKALDGMGLVYDPGLDKFVYFQDDGFLYTITRVSPTAYSVDRMTLAGTPPAVLGSGVHNGGGYVGVWSRMQYIPRLRGVCIIQAYDRPAYFVRTA